MAELDIALILRLVDRFSGPARAAAQSLSVMAAAGRKVGAASGEQAGKIGQAGKALGRTAEAARSAIGANTALLRTAAGAAEGERALGTAATSAAAQVGRGSVQAAAAARSATALGRTSQTAARGERTLGAAAVLAGAQVGRSGSAARLAATGSTALGRAAVVAASGQRSLGAAAVVAGAGESRAAAAAEHAGGAAGQLAQHADVATASALRLMSGLDTTAAAAEHAAERATRLYYGQDRVERSAGDAARAERELASSTGRAGSAADTAARRFSGLERAQMRGQAASRKLKSEYAKFDRRIGTLARAEIATAGAERAGRAVARPLARAVASSASFEQGMTGIGITNRISDADLTPFRAAILEASRRLAMPTTAVQATFGAVQNEGAYTKRADLIEASRQTAALQRVSKVMGDPVGDTEAGALTNAFGNTLKWKASQLEQGYAMMLRSAQLGGVRIETVSGAFPQLAGQLKGLRSDTPGGVADILAGLQISKRTAGDDATAAINFKDFLGNMSHRLTLKRFKAEGIDLEENITAAVKRGGSALDAMLDSIDAVLKKHPEELEAFGVGHLFQNQQARDAAIAMTQNRADLNRIRSGVRSPGGRGGLSGRREARHHGPAS